MAKSVQQVVDRWKAGGAGGQTAYTEGIQNTQIDVVGRAIGAAADAVRNYADSITSGRWARALNESGGTPNWKARSIAKAQNWSTGVNQSGDKYARAAAKFLPAIEQIVSSLPPRQPGNVAANVNNRVLGLAQALHARKGEFKG